MPGGPLRAARRRPAARASAPNRSWADPPATINPG